MWILFNSIYSFYREKWPSHDPELYAWLLLSTLQAFNILTVIMIIQRYVALAIPDWVIGAEIILITIKNYFVYMHKGKYKNRIVEFDSNLPLKKKWRWLTVGYIAVSAISLYVTALAGYYTRHS